MSNPSIKNALDKIFAGIEELKKVFKDDGKSFTIDGRLVGDIGEVLVARDYDVTLYKEQKETHDGYTSLGQLVQIKATFKKKLTFKKTPEYYLGVLLKEDGTYEEIYNGPGKYIEERYSHRAGLGFKTLPFPISVLQEIFATIPQSEKIPKRKG